MCVAQNSQEICCVAAKLARVAVLLLAPDGGAREEWAPRAGKSRGPFPPLRGLRSLCVSCHNTKTNALDHPRSRRDGRGLAFKGCDENGLPIDPDHPSMQGYTPLEDETDPPRDRVSSQEKS